MSLWIGGWIHQISRCDFDRLSPLVSYSKNIQVRLSASEGKRSERTLLLQIRIGRGEGLNASKLLLPLHGSFEGAHSWSTGLTAFAVRL